MAQSHDDVKTVDPRFDAVYQRGYDSANPKSVVAPKPVREPMNEPASALRSTAFETPAEVVAVALPADSPLDEKAYLAETAAVDASIGSAISPTPTRSPLRDPLLLGLWVGGAALAVASFLLFLWSGRAQWTASFAFQSDPNGDLSTDSSGRLESVLGLQFLQAVTPTLFLIGVSTIVAATLIAAHRRTAKR